jgi:hypothetical protein
MTDLDAAVNAFAKSFESQFSPPMARIYSAIEGAKLNYSRNFIGDASRMLAAAVRLLPTASPRTLRRDDKQYSISQFDGVAADACAISILNGGDVYEAIELLEIGRGVMASVYFDTRNDVSSLENAYPELAEKFRNLRDQLDTPSRDDTRKLASSPQSTLEYQSAERYELSNEFDNTILEIRSKEGFTRFLCGPSCEELKSLASVGPLVFLNVSSYVTTPSSLLVMRLNIYRFQLSRIRMYKKIQSCWSKHRRRINSIPGEKPIAR